MKINIQTPIGGTGYGVAGLNIIKSLHNLGHTVYTHLIGQNYRCNNEEEAALIKQTIEQGKLYDYNSPSLKIWHQFDLSTHIGRGLNVGFPIFELDTFTEQEKHQILSTDKLFVCSHWAKQIVERETDHYNKRGSRIHDVCVVPLGVDSSVFYPRTTAKKDNTYRFFNCGKIEIRKGHDILLDIFNKAFTKEDNVELNIMFYNPFMTQEENHQWVLYYENSPLKNKVKIIPPVKTNREVADIMRQMDCGIFMSHAEGFNLELLEMQACGKPVITTNYSAHTEYCNKDNAYLIEIDEVEPAYDGKWFFKQGNWAKIGQKQIDQCINWMRCCYANKLRNNPNGIETAKKFSWENTAKTIVKHLT